MKTKIPVILLLLIFAVSVSSGAARACCWDMERSEHHSETAKSETENEPCHKVAENNEKAPDENKQEPNDCCYDMAECQLQLIKITKAVSVQPTSFVLLNYSSTDNFNSNTVEPLKHPPKVLL